MSPIAKLNVRGVAPDRPTSSLFAAACAGVLLCAIPGCSPRADTDSHSPTTPSEATASAPFAKGQEIDYGTLIEFTAGGNAEPLKVSGWSNPENGFTWTEGNAAILSARVPATDSPVTLRLKAAGSIKEPELPFQPVEVYVNNEKIADIQVGNTAEFTAPVPQSVTKNGGLLTITFRIPKAASPKSLQLNEDARQLGMRVFNLELSKVQ